MNLGLLLLDNQPRSTRISHSPSPDGLNGVLALRFPSDEFQGAENRAREICELAALPGVCNVPTRPPHACMWANLGN
eukprot:7658415-Pyramimonas_sp.AAC.1